MLNSYVNLDEYMRFLNSQNNKKVPTRSILDVGVACALNENFFDKKSFLARGGKFKWTKISEQLNY